MKTMTKKKVEQREQASLCSNVLMEMKDREKSMLTNELNKTLREKCAKENVPNDLAKIDDEKMNEEQKR